MKAAIYCRVSTTDQDLTGQERELREEVTRRGDEVVVVYSEKVSGTGKVERAAYEQLLRDARRPDRPWSGLDVWSMDRFSHAETFTQATQAVLDLEKLGIRFRSLKEPMVNTPEDGKPNLGRDVLIALLPVIASFESRRRQERVRLAMKEIKEGRRSTRSGRPPGRPRRVTPEIAAKAKALRESGLSWAAVAQRAALPKETCRRAVYELRKAEGAVENSDRGKPSPDGQSPLGA